MERTHFNGTLTKENIGQDVVLVGWVSKWRNLGSLLFIDLRDRSGIIQVVVRRASENNDPSFQAPECPDVRNEYVIQVFGKVEAKAVENKALKTGAIEVVASKVVLINKAQTTPLIIDDETDALEDVRLKYRYLDLRRPVMQERLITRAKIVKAFHEYLDENGFLEIETPLLTLSTPGGARDFLVPSRVHPGHFYALPQSPQIFKQLFMIGGLERYYQIARCFRDEDLRADRQPDFTQVDIEMSFLDQDQVLTLMEGALAKVFKTVKGIDLKLPLRRLEYLEAVNRYGSDKPDTRFGFELQDVHPLFTESAFEAFKTASSIKAVVVPGIAKATSRKVLDELNLIARKYHLKGVTPLKVEGGVLTGSFTKFLSEKETQGLFKALSLKEDDLVILAGGSDNTDVCFALGAIRIYFAKSLNLIKPNTFDLLWVVHFPLFEINDAGKLVSAHHQFTRPCQEDLPLLDSDPIKVFAQAFDIVINGYEAGGGSMRIYDHDVQYKIFEVLGMSEEDIKKQFGFFIDAFNYGTPPHGGLAFGLDRLAMILSGTDNIRDVIAFPKNLASVCPLTKAPGTVEPKQTEELSIAITKMEKDS